MQRTFVFIDGAYLRTHANEACSTQYINIRTLANHIQHERGVFDGRVIRSCYYDAESVEPTDPTDAGLGKYWKKIERLDDVELRFGYLRSRTRKTPRQQKGVDVLLAVDLVVGAFTRLFDSAILVTGDADFIPAVHEAQRRGIIVVLAAFKNGTSSDLIDACDRVYDLDEQISKFKMNID